MKLSRVSLAPRGGMVDTPANTPEGFARYLENAFYRMGSYVWRAGVRLINATEYVDTLVGCWAFKSSGAAAPTRAVIAVSAGTEAITSSFLKLVGTAFTPIPYNGVVGPPHSPLTDFWRSMRAALVSDSAMYAARRTYKGGMLYHVTENQVTQGWVDPPVAAPTVTSSGTVGVVPAGVYPVAYRYRTTDGQYSPMSPATLSGAITLNEKRRWSVVASTHPRVVAIELMLGFVSGEAEQVYFAYDAPNITGLYDEDVLDSELDTDRAGNFRLVIPPSGVEDLDAWDAQLWLVSNSPSPLIWHSNIDAAGATFETYDPQAVLELPVRGGRRYMAFRGWDRARAIALTDSSAHVIEPAAGLRYSIRDIDESHGCVGAAAVDIGGGMAAWFDGRNFLASDGGPAAIVSTGFVDEILSKVPDAYADRAIVKYTPEDGANFMLCVPSTPESVRNDMMLCWDKKEWHIRTFFGGVKAPQFLNRIPGEAAQWITVAGFHGQNRVYRLDYPSRRDEGPVNIPVEFETAAVKIPSGYGTCSVARVHIGVRRRPDTDTVDPEATLTASVHLRLDDTTDTATKTAVLDVGKQYIHVRTQNLSKPAANVAVVVSFDHPDVLEVYDLWAEVVFYRREDGRT